MNYGLIYTIPFASLRKEACVVEIEMEGYTGAVKELTGSDSTFNVEIDDNDFLYTPSRFSTATIRIVGNDYLQSLFSTAYQQYRVTFKRNNTVMWCGFIKPEIYTQDYCSDKFELEIECVSALSTLEYINYKSDQRSFVSLWHLAQKCIQSAGGRYSAVYLPHVYASSVTQYNAGENVLEKMTISEQNFFDEDDEAMTLKEVLEEICKILNWTVCDWKGELYFVDVDHQGKYYKYDGSLSSKIGEVDGNSINVQAVGFSGTGHTLDMLPGYNKATVRVSNYPVGAQIKEEDYDNLTIAVTPFDTWESIEGGVSVGHKVVYLPKNIEMQQWTLKDDKYAESVTSVWVSENKSIANSLLGAMPIKYCNYEIIDHIPLIHSYSYENAIQIRWVAESYTENLHSMEVGRNPNIIFRGASAVYSDGAFAINCSLGHIYRPNMGIMPKSKYWGATPKLKCTLRIGNSWYNGYGWEKYDYESNPYDYPYFHVEFSGLFTDAEFVSVKNTKTLDMPYGDITGQVIEIGDEPLTGSLEFSIFGSFVEANDKSRDDTYGIVLKDLEFKYTKRDDMPSDLENNSDRYYENVVNESYINKLDEIEFKISSYNNDGACYSKVMLGDKYLESNLYASVAEELIRPEELLIHRIVNRYDVTRIKLIQVIQETPNLTPLTKLSDNFMVNKIFINAGGSIDYKMGQFKCVMIEI